MVKLQSSDGVVCEVTAAQAARSAFLSSLLEEENGGDGTDEPIFTPRLSGRWLTLILQCLSLAPHPQIPVPLPNAPLLLSNVLHPAYFDLVHNFTSSEFAELMTAADFVQVDDVVYMCGAALALAARGMASEAAVRSFFNPRLSRDLLRVVSAFSDLPNRAVTLDKDKDEPVMIVDFRPALFLVNVNEVAVHVTVFDGHKQEGEEGFETHETVVYKKRKACDDEEEGVAAAVHYVPDLYDSPFLLRPLSTKIIRKRTHAKAVCGALAGQEWVCATPKLAAELKSTERKRVLCTRIVMKCGAGCSLDRVLELEKEE